MKKVLIMMTGAMLLINSCGTYEATGAFTGAQFGSIIGSAIGGITGGWRGSNVGTLVGMAGGAAVGAAVGRAADERSQRQYEEHVYQREQRRQAAAIERHYDDSGFDSAGRGDDRIEFLDDHSSDYASSGNLEIRNPRLVDHSHDNLLTRGEEARMVFEIYNNSSKPVYRVLPSVMEISGNKHIHISENVLIESIQPYQTLRYTAMVKADNRLKDGEAVIQITVFQGNTEHSSQRKVFSLRTSRN